MAEEDNDCFGQSLIRDIPHANDRHHDSENVLEFQRRVANLHTFCMGFVHCSWIVFSQIIINKTFIQII